MTKKVTNEIFDDMFEDMAEHAFNYKLFMKSEDAAELKERLLHNFQYFNSRIIHLQSKIDSRIMKLDKVEEKCKKAYEKRIEKIDKYLIKLEKLLNPKEKVKKVIKNDVPRGTTDPKGIEKNEQ